MGAGLHRLPQRGHQSPGLLRRGHALRSVLTSSASLRRRIPFIGVQRPARRTENVLRSIDIPIMRDTTGATSPLSYPQRTQSTRTRPCETGRASHAGEPFTTWDADTSKPDGFVVQLLSDHAPGRIVGRCGKRSVCKLGAGHIAYHD